jgi:hypothetical protein
MQPLTRSPGFCGRSKHSFAPAWGWRHRPPGTPDFALAMESCDSGFSERLIFSKQFWR